MITTLLGGTVIAALVSALACRLIIAARLMDSQSGTRHAHKTPTPTSGGIGIGLGFGAALIALAAFTDLFQTGISAQGLLLMAASVGFSAVFLIVGFWDDVQALSARLKFVVFAALAIAATLLVHPVQGFPIGDRVVVAPYWFGLIGTALWVFVMVNTVNFLDGANGLAMGSVAIGLAFLTALSLRFGSPAGVVLTSCAVGALLGFLIWNFPKGRLFAGDAGALFIGAMAALVSVTVIHRTGVTPLVPAIVFFPLLADALITLAWRAYKRHTLLDGHSEHVYQILMHGGVSHAEVAMMYWTAMAGCGVIAYLVADDPGVAPWLAMAVLAFLAVVISAVVRRFASRRNVTGV